MNGRERWMSRLAAVRLHYKAEYDALAEYEEFGTAEVRRDLGVPTRKEVRDMARSTRRKGR